MATRYYDSEVYKPGDAKIAFLHSIDCDDDAQYDEAYHEPTELCDSHYVIYLPHQCDSWSIGQLSHLQTMIKDLAKIEKCLLDNGENFS